MKILKNKKVFIPLLVLVLLVGIIGISYSTLLYDDELVLQNTDLTYYLDVYYDGVDKDGVKSSDTTVSNVNSGYMIVEDKLPEGLTFKGFVTTSDGTIGAIKRSDGTSCAGSVLDDTKEDRVDSGTWNSDNTEYYYHGLHYNAETKTVSFKVKNLKAGCKLTVGIITRVPASVDNPNTPDEVETRKDFYNVATIRENDITVLSNILHAYMGKKIYTSHKVTYSYLGDVPENTPTFTREFIYSVGDQVGVTIPVNIEGYTFSGWETSDVTVTDGSFIMPDHDVNFTGSYVELPKYKVKYVIDGQIPDGYVIPSEKEYYQDNSINIDSMNNDAVFNGYRFSGWTTDDITVIQDEGIFIMPNHDVTFIGSFSEAKYRINYVFYNTVLPPNAESILPSPQEVKAGEIVILPTVSDIDNYQFLGWNKENNFVMPNNDITIYGEWIENRGTFDPTITIEIVEPKEVYHADDSITFKITVKNNSSFAINDLIVRENNDNVIFATNDNYEVQSNHFAKIGTLGAGATQNIFATYKVLKTDYNTITNEVEIVGGLADNHQLLKSSKSSVNFDVTSNLIVHHYIIDTTTKVYEDEIFELPFGSTYQTNSIDSSKLFDDYKNSYRVLSDSGNVTGIISNNNVEVTYYYGINMYHINVNVIGGVGTITGYELVAARNNSKEDILIKPSQGYEINKILINGEEISITNKDEMLLDKFNNVREDKTVEVEFVEKEQAAPITGASAKIYLIVNIIVSLAFVMYILYRKTKGEVL